MEAGSRFPVVSSYPQVLGPWIRSKLHGGSLAICKKLQIERGHVDWTFVPEIQYGEEKEQEVTWVLFLWPRFLLASFPTRLQCKRTVTRYCHATTKHHVHVFMARIHWLIDFYLFTFEVEVHRIEICF